MSAINVADKVIEFVRNTILGQERGMYRQHRDICNTDVGLAVQLHVLATYMNSAYRAIITKNNDYFVQVFKSMHNESG